MSCENLLPCLLDYFERRRIQYVHRLVALSSNEAARMHEVVSLGLAFWGNRCRTIKALSLSLVLCGFLAALHGVVASLAGLVPEILHFAMYFAKEVLVGLIFHDEQFTPPWRRDRSN